MIAAAFGHDVGIDTLRRAAGASGRGVTLTRLIEVAHGLGLLARPLRLRLNELRQLRCPAILHWRMQHFVVLVRCSRRGAIIHDPARGRRKVDFDELDGAFTGIAVEFTPQQGFRPVADRHHVPLIAFLGTFRGLRRYLGLMLLLLFGLQVFAVLPAVVMQVLIDNVLLGHDRDWLGTTLAGLSAVMVAALVLDALRRWFGLYTGTRLAADSTLKVVAHVFALPAAFVAERHVGDVLSKISSLEPIRIALTEHGTNLVVQVTAALSILALMLAYSPALTVVSAASLAASLAILLAVLPATRARAAERLVHRAAEQSSLIETLRGFATVQALDLPVRRIAHWQQPFHRALDAEVRQGKLDIARVSATGFIGVCDQVAFLGLGIAGVADREITLGVLFAFMALRARLGSAVVATVDLVHRFFLLSNHTARLSDLLLAEPVAAPPPGAVRRRIVGALSAERLGLRYGDGPWLLRDFCCRISPGTHVVITGPSGCGKSTLLHALAGQRPPAEGRILVDGIELALWHRAALSAQCAVVLQDESLFEGTVIDNISAFSATPDLERARAAAVMAEVWRDIEALPMQLQTLLQDSARALSGGQVQRLVLARALYRMPRILFLDEATSHLDVALERKVLAKIAATGATIVSVAHRPDAVAAAGEVIRLGG